MQRFQYVEEPVELESSHRHQGQSHLQQAEGFQQKWPAHF